MENDDFFDRVWQVVDRIPRGKVTTYGHIAEYLDQKSSARTVGWALAAAKGTPLPCHRVVNRFGALSGAPKFGGPHIMEDLLRNEGVAFTDENCVNLDRHLWIPSPEGKRTKRSATKATKRAVKKRTATKRTATKR